MTSNEQRTALQRKIWDIANDVRGAVDGWDFKQYVLGSLFYRFISENFIDYITGGDASVDYAAMADDGSFELIDRHGDSNKSFPYHLNLLQTIEHAIADGKVERFHFTLLRNLYEKTASFLGDPKWSELLPDDKQLYYSRIINFTSHSTLSNEAVAQPTPPESATVKLLLEHLKNSHRFWQPQGA